MHTAQDTRTRISTPRRWAWCGFVVGIGITVPATFVALLSRAGEALHPYLVPSTALLGPLSDTMATWPGVVNVTVAAVVNGVVYAVGAGGLGALLAMLGRHTSNSD